MSAYSNPVEPYQEYFNALKIDRSSKGWDNHWSELSDYIAPDRGRYLSTGALDGEVRLIHNDGRKTHDLIINGTGELAARTIAAGMQSNITPPTRPWFNLRVVDDEAMQDPEVQWWLWLVRNLILAGKARSNYYESKHNVYHEEAVFGTGAMFIEEDLEAMFRYRPLTIGEYWISSDAQQRPDVLYRMFIMTARQLRDTFGLDVLPQEVKNCLVSADQAVAGQVEREFTVIHGVQPRKVLDLSKADARGMKYESVYFLENLHEGKFLRQGGYRTCPFIAPRWNVTGTDVYGKGPGSVALGDIKQLQKMETKKLKGLDKQIDPPMNAPSSAKGEGLSIISGGVNFLDLGPGQQGFTPAYQVQLNFRDIDVAIDKVERRIERTFYNELFLAVVNETKRMTAEEIVERRTEKMELLGPVMERQQNEDLDPCFDREFDILMNLNLVPPAPARIRGMPLKVDYSSPLMQVQKMADLAPLDRLMLFLSQAVLVEPGIKDKVNFDEAADLFATSSGIAPKIIRSDEEVAQIREVRAQQIRDQIASERGAAVAKGAKELSQAKMGEGSALDFMAEKMGIAPPEKKGG